MVVEIKAQYVGTRPCIKTAAGTSQEFGIGVDVYQDYTGTFIHHGSGQGNYRQEKEFHGN